MICNMYEYVMSHPDTSEATVMTDVMSRVRPQAPFRLGFCWVGAPTLAETTLSAMSCW